MAFAEKYVTVTGGGLHDGSSEANAWTFYEAYSNHSAGDRINIKAGTYSITQSTSTWQSGTVSSPLSFRGYKTSIGDLDNRPASQLVSGTDLPLIQSTNGSYYPYINAYRHVWENIAFESTSYRPAAYVVTSYSIWRRCRFYSDSAYGVINRPGGDNTHMHECYFISPSGTAPVDSSNSTTFSSCVFDGITTINSYEYFGLTNSIIKNTTSDGLTLTGFGWLNIEGNTFYNINGNAITMSSIYAARQPSVISNNVFHTVSGNAIQANSISRFQVFSQNNLFYNVTGSNVANDGFGMSRDEQNDSTDPFVDAAAGDYSLVSGSNGYNNAAPKPFEVFDVNSNRDIGAVQHQDPSGGGGGSTFHPLAQ